MEEEGELLSHLSLSKLDLFFLLLGRLLNDGLLLYGFDEREVSVDVLVDHLEEER